MRRKLILLGLALAATAGLEAGLFSPAAQAQTTTCWQVECNTCCKSKGGPTICTERACV
ncbi:MAG TPA: hypothetical protein VF789_21355 [Thermoanaerobaculia bacterium]